jgi:hypothetical protein
LISCSEQNVRGMGTDKTCSACDKNSRHSIAFVGAK